jgi:hypothetical protein
LAACLPAWQLGSLAAWQLGSLPACLHGSLAELGVGGLPGLLHAVAKTTDAYVFIFFVAVGDGEIMGRHGWDWIT